MGGGGGGPPWGTGGGGGMFLVGGGGGGVPIALVGVEGPRAGGRGGGGPLVLAGGGGGTPLLVGGTWGRGPVLRGVPKITSFFLWKDFKKYQNYKKIFCYKYLHTNLGNSNNCFRHQLKNKT